MSWSYSIATLSTSLKDQVRLLVHDNDVNEQLMEASLRIEELESELALAKRGAFTSTTNAVYVADLANRVAEAMEARELQRSGLVGPVMPVVKARGKKVAE